MNESAEGAMEQVQAERMGTRQSVEVDLIVGARSGDQEAFGRLMAGRMEPSFRTIHTTADNFATAISEVQPFIDSIDFAVTP